MLSFEKCKEILNNEEKKYTDDEIKIIRNFLYQLGHFDYLNFKRKENAKSHHLHKGKHRRARRKGL